MEAKVEPLDNPESIPICATRSLTVTMSTACYSGGIELKDFVLRASNVRIRFHDFPGGGIPILFIRGLGCAVSFDDPNLASPTPLAGADASSWIYWAQAIVIS